MYPVCNAYTPESSVILQYFSHYLINGTIFEKKVTEQIMCVWILSTNFFLNTSHSKNNWARYDQKCVFVFTWSTRYSCQVLTKREFSRQIFEKYSNIRFHKNPSNGSPVVLCGQADRHDEVNGRFWQLLECAEKLLATFTWKPFAFSSLEYKPK